MMSDISCGYHDREAALVAWLYDDIDPAAREAFGAHLESCARCRRELDALGGVRKQLARWAPPAFPVGSDQSQPAVGSGQAAVVDQQSNEGRGPWWREMPAWAQVAAAMLVLGVSAGIANLDVRYDQNGLAIRTGWSRPAQNVATPANPPSAANAAILRNNSAPWRGDLAALERQLRTEFRASSLATTVSPVAVGVSASRPGMSEPELMRRLKAMIDESERKQERELALRVAEVLRDVNTQRQADLRKIDQNLGLIEGRTGVEVFKNREMVNYLMQRVSQRQ